MKNKGKVIIRIFVLFILAFIFMDVPSSYTARDDKKLKIKVAGDENFPPYEFVDSKGVYKGFNIDIMRSIEIETGIEIEIIPMKWKDAIEALEKGEVDAIQGLTKSPNREMMYSFTNELLINSQVIFVKSSTNFISELEDLSGWTVSIQKGDITEEKVREIKGVNIITTDNQKQALGLLIEGKVDAFVGNRLTGLYNLQKQNKIKEVKIVGEPLAKTEYCSAALKGNDSVIKNLNKGIEAIKKNKTYDKIYYKWFGEELSNLNSEIRKMLLISVIALVFTTVVIIIIMKVNKGLKRAINERTKELAVTNKELEIINEKLLLEITERKKDAELIWHQANYDFLTNLPNRKHFVTKLSEEMKVADKENHKIAIIFIDLDDFKHINDTLGHNSGDMLLKEVGIRLKKALGEMAFVSRFGGDEFTIMITNIRSKEDIEYKSRDIIEAMKMPFVINGIEIQQEVSIGVSIYPDSGRDFDLLLGKADAMMYDVKSEGGNDFRID